MVDDFKSRGGSPWGTPPGGGNGSGRKGPTPPDIDEIIRTAQEKIKKFMPGNFQGGNKPLLFGLIVILIVWALSGLYRVQWLMISKAEVEVLGVHPQEAVVMVQEEKGQPHQILMK